MEKGFRRKEIRKTTDNQFNTRGIVAMANGGPDTNKSQVCLTLDQPKPTQTGL